MIAKARYIKDNKKFMSNLPSEEYIDPKYVFIATQNVRCKKAEIFIKEGDTVMCYQVIGMRYGDGFEQPIHATVSGKYLGLEKHYHRNGRLVDFIKIENDFKNKIDKSVKERSDDEIAKLSKDEITKIVKNSALVGLGGSSFPTYIKLQTDKKINTILINGVECEPYISADQRMMLENPDKVIKGILYAIQTFNADKAYICIKSKYKEVRELYTQILIDYPQIELKCLGNFYPQGWEHAVIKGALGINVEDGKLPMDYGVINFNVSTVVGLYDAIKYNKPVIERYVTVNGDGIVNPKNFIVKVGTPVKELIEKCGGYKDEDIDKVIILGGPMMGESLPNDDCIITKTVTSVIVLNNKEEKEENCVRCGSCVMSCPAHLQPVMIMNAVKAKDKERIKLLNPNKCMECGLCTYCCTSKIHVTEYIRKAKIFAKL